MLTPILFEDAGVNQLWPITIGRPAYAISCGGYRLLDVVNSLCPTSRAVVRPYLTSLQSVDHPSLSDSSTSCANGALLLNARLAPSFELLSQLTRLSAMDHAAVVMSGSSVAAAVVPKDFRIDASSTDSILIDGQTVADFAEMLASRDTIRLDDKLPLFEYPHDVIRLHLEIIAGNLKHRIQLGDLEEVRDGVFVGDNVKFSDYVITDTSDGPIILEAGTSVGPYSLISGPAIIGPKSRILEHAAIKDAVALGHTTKIGGEVEASIVEPYTNKQHHGFLGHSYLGSWINLGAGTCNSDLKNTYGTVNMEYRGAKVQTNMQFVGCIMGDYAKSAINTGIFTGKTIGACSMTYGFVTTNVPSFVNYARLFGQVTELPPEVMIATQKRMFARRNVTQRPVDSQLIYDMYELTKDDRKIAGEPLAL